MADGMIYRFYDYESREELEGFIAPALAICPRIGEVVRVIIDDRADLGLRRIADIEHQVFAGATELDARHLVLIYLA
ncbi:MAG: hypothetical protein NVV72_00960 [Asticcacaulis sp.]|nr:hypothetical protein [Asticcacaulis sp.]